MADSQGYRAARQLAEMNRARFGEAPPDVLLIAGGARRRLHVIASVAGGRALVKTRDPRGGLLVATGNYPNDPRAPVSLFTERTTGRRGHNDKTIALVASNCGRKGIQAYQAEEPESTWDIMQWHRATPDKGGAPRITVKIGKATGGRLEVQAVHTPAGNPMGTVREQEYLDDLPTAYDNAYSIGFGLEASRKSGLWACILDEVIPQGAIDEAIEPYAEMVPGQLAEGEIAFGGLTLDAHSQAVSSYNPDQGL